MMLAISSRQVCALVSLGVLLRIVWSAPTTNPDTSNKSSDHNVKNEVSWQSVFWALFTLAINSMTQPSMFDKGISPSNLLFPAHSSPVVCLVDALDVLAEFRIFLSLGESLQDAAWQIQWRRSQYRLGPDIQSIGETALEIHPITTALLFLGPLSQAIKIFACSGISWVKVIAGMYLSSYIILTLTLYLAPQNWRNCRAPPIKEHIKNARTISAPSYSAYWAVEVGWIGQKILYFWGTKQVIFSANPQYSDTVEHLPLALQMFLWSIGTSLTGLIFSITLLVAFCVPLFGMWFGLISPNLAIRGVNNIAWLVYLTCSVVWLVIYSIIWYSLFSLTTPPINYDDVFRSLQKVLIDKIWEILLIAIIWGIYVLVLKLLVKPWPFIRRRVPMLRWLTPKLGRMYLIVFSVSNLAGTLLYCNVAYHSKGTIKPGWTEYLG